MKDQNEPESPQDVGASLRKRRTLRGESLDAIHQHTRIPKKFIEALEENRFQDLPAPVYLRGFLKSYCDHLDIEFEPVWKKLSQPAAPAAKAEPAPAAEAPAHGTEEAPARDSHDGPVLLPFTESTLLPVILFSVLAAVGIALWALKADSPSGHPVVRPPQDPAQVAMTPTEPPPAPRGMSLKVTALQECWIRLTADGTLRFEGSMPLASEQQWTAEKGFLLKAANPRALRVELDGTEVGLPALKPEPDGNYLLRR